MSGGVLNEKDFSRCTLCIRIMCLVYIAVILFLNCIFVFLSTAVQEVPDTELKHCEDIFNVTGDTSHKFLHQVAMEQNLHCIDINITDGLLSVVLVIISLVSVIALLCLEMRSTISCLCGLRQTKFTEPSIMDPTLTLIEGRVV